MDALVLRVVPLSEPMTGRCFACCDRIEADGQWVKAFDADGGSLDRVRAKCESVVEG